MNKSFKILAIIFMMIFTLVMPQLSIPSQANAKIEDEDINFDAERAVEHVRYLSEEIGVRVAGTEEEKEAANYIKNEFEKIGYDATLQEFEFDVRREDNLIINDGLEIPLRSAQMTRETPKEGVNAEIVDLGYGDQDNYGEEVEGKIIFIQRGKTSFVTAAEKAKDAGALALIVANSEEEDGLRAFRPGTSNEEVDVPLVGITYPDGQKIKESLEHNEITTADLLVVNHEKQTSQNVIAVKEATVENPDIVYVTSHMDSVPFAPGANDNASGTGLILELARGMQNYDSNTEIRFVAFGHEEAGAGPSRQGSKYYVNNLTEDELDRSIANFNFDMVATSWEEASSLNLNIVDGQANRLSEYAMRAADSLGMDKSIINVFKKGSSDHETFYDAGIDSANFSWRVPGTADLEPYYHSPEDTMEHISVDKMKTIGQLASTALFNEFHEVEREWMTNDEYLQKMNGIVNASNGKVEFDVAGHSSQGTEIMSARVGTGDQVILINSSIHGNEKSGVEAIVEILDYLGTSDDSFAQSVRDEVTIVTIPRYNVDGLEIPQRQNVFPWDEVLSVHPQLEGAEPAWYYNQRNQGFDINRDFNADLNYKVVAEDLPGNTLLPGFFITKESQLLRDLYVELQGEFGEVEAFVDLHHMGTPKLNESGESVTIAVDYPPLGNDPTKYDDYPKLDQDKSKRYSLAAALGVQEFSDKDEPGVSQYVHFAERDYPGQARSAFALNGSASILFEMPGQQPAYGYDQELVDRVENGLWGIISRMADGSIDDLNGEDFLTEVPRYWTDSITDMRDVMKQFTEEGQFENASDARLLDNQLAALEKYEKQEDSTKMVKHLNGFKVLIDHLQTEGLIDKSAYNRLNGDVNMLINRWK